MDLPAAAIGATVSVMASGAGDGDTPAMAEALLTGASVAPPSPVHLHVRTDGDGGLAVRWVRRSRAGWHWIDGIDAALAEERELYFVGRGGDVGPPLVAVTVPEAVLPAGSWEDAAAIAVRQAGAYAPSRPAQRNL